MIIEFFLPERLPGFSLERCRGLGFKSLYELAEITGGLKSLQEEVDMVWHEAISVHREGMSGGLPLDDI